MAPAVPRSCRLPGPRPGRVRKNGRPGQQLGISAPYPAGELLARGPVCLVVTQQALDEVGQRVRGDLEPAYLPAEPGVGAERPAQVHLEAFLTVDDRALKPDVSELEPGARVRAAVHVDRDRCVEIWQPAAELGVEVAGAA